MKKITLLMMLLLTTLGWSQEDAWVYFNDKPGATAFFNNPLTELSQRSLDRRTAQNIALDIKDAPISQNYINQISAASGIIVMAKSKWLNCVHVRGEATDIAALSSLSFVHHIFYANTSLNNRAVAVPTRQKPVNKQLETLVNFNYGNSFNQIHMLNGDLLHQQNYTGAGKIIAVLDAGFPGVDSATPFDRLRNNNQILGGYDYVGRTDNFYTSNSHGTMVLSTMGGYVDGELVGTAPDAKYYLYITEDVSSENPVEESNWVEAAEQADRVGADVITSSLGYFAFDNPAYGHTYEDMTGNSAFASQGANIAFTRGMVVVASAGNEGNNDEPHVGVPAEANNVLAIGAVRSNRSRASFSSIGPSFDGRIKPDVMAQGQASVLSDTAGNIVTANGTSFSGPITAGMIATFWSAVPSLTQQQVVNFVKQSADRFTNPDNEYGYGIPDFSLALSEAQQFLGIQTNEQEMVSVFPNPAATELNVALPSDVNQAQINLYNQIGQLVLSQEVNQSSSKISLNTIESGLYLYRIESASFVSTGKITKK
ncbi:MAG: S8 family serine peptidase [Flavobacteriaceae bacterium]